ncbi:carbohydrate sulfotransferase 11-like [Patiria miniata]|uniref:Carbohydrate sulfotransferase n=1 Tax=Patiria miniata TaxID=46514 RepID=A0A914AF53_PATMI|nr:carbohydrate sulfotransferase 11-like [Patiria miniata]XP_038061999.1 carbohydrate sulfotransferase 11-like [Patiria miniata]
MALKQLQSSVSYRRCFKRTAFIFVLAAVCLIVSGASYHHAKVKTAISAALTSLSTKPDMPSNSPFTEETRNVSYSNELQLLAGNHSDSVQQILKKLFTAGQKRKPDKHFMEEQAFVQFQRKKTLRQACRRHPYVMQREQSSGQFFVMEKSQILYCSVPKTGCTNWKRVFMVLEGDRPNTENISGNDAHFSNNFKQLSHRRLLRDIRKYDAYTKFLQVRHPFVRLISAYRNKISGETPLVNQGEEFGQMAEYIVRKYRRGAGIEDYNLSTLHVTWAEWIRYLTDPTERRDFNAHWREVYKLCLPCRINYDFIGNLETVGSDSGFMLDHLGLADLHFPSSRAAYLHDSEKRGEALFDQYFGNVSREDIQRLYDIYKVDFELFGFEKPWQLY